MFFSSSKSKYQRINGEKRDTTDQPCMSLSVTAWWQPWYVKSVCLSRDSIKFKIGSIVCLYLSCCLSLYVSKNFYLSASLWSYASTCISTLPTVSAHMQFSVNFNLSHNLSLYVFPKTVTWPYMSLWNSTCPMVSVRRSRCTPLKPCQVVRDREVRLHGAIPSPSPPLRRDGRSCPTAPHALSRTSLKPPRSDAKTLLSAPIKALSSRDLLNRKQFPQNWFFVSFCWCYLPVLALL